MGQATQNFLAGRLYLYLKIWLENFAQKVIIKSGLFLGIGCGPERPCV